MQGRLTTNHNELRANRIVSVLGGSPKCSVGETHQVQTPMEKLLPWFTQKIAEHHPYMKEFHIYVKTYTPQKNGILKHMTILHGIRYQLWSNPPRPNGWQVLGPKSYLVVDLPL